MHLKETYNRIAELWREDHADDIWWVDGTNAFIDFLEPGSLVLDVGCGAGVKSRYLTERSLKVLGIDFSEKMIEICRRDIPEAEFRVLDMRQAGALEESFDGIFAQASLLHIKKDEVAKVLENLVSRLKRGGHLYLAVKEIRSGQPEEMIQKEDDYGFSYERFFSYFTLDELKKHMQQLGLETVFDCVEKSNKTRWIQIISRK